MQVNFAKVFSGAGGTAKLVVQMNKTGPMSVTLVDKKSTPVLDKAGNVVGKTYTGGVTAKLGQTQKNSFEVTAQVDGAARSESDVSRSFNHEAGHTGGLNHPWEPGNPSDIQQGGAGVKESTVKSNLMNSDENPDASNKSHSGTDLTSGQLSKIDNTISGQQP